VILPSVLSSASRISFLSLSCISGRIASSYKVKAIVVEEVSKPAVKKTAACATRSSPSNSKISIYLF